MTGRVLLGVSGGVAAYKAPQLASQLVQKDCEVRVVLTAAGRRFASDAAFAALTNARVCTELFDPAFPLGAHIELAEWADLLCVAPATADILAKCAWGFADDLLSTLYLAFDGPVMMAPAMNTTMWERAPVQRAVRQLTADGVQLIAPREGWLSCRRRGSGRMEEPAEILQLILAQLSATS